MSVTLDVTPAAANISNVIRDRRNSLLDALRTANCRIERAIADLEAGNLPTDSTLDGSVLGTVALTVDKEAVALRALLNITGAAGISDEAILAAFRGEFIVSAGA